MGIQSGVKPHQRSHYEKAFILKCSLTIYMGIHNGLKPPQFSQCDKAFVHKYDITIHMRTHNLCETISM